MASLDFNKLIKRFSIVEEYLEIGGFSKIAKIKQRWNQQTLKDKITANRWSKRNIKQNKRAIKRERLIFIIFEKKRIGSKKEKM